MITVEGKAVHEQVFEHEPSSLFVRTGIYSMFHIFVVVPGAHAGFPTFEGPEALRADALLEGLVCGSFAACFELDIRGLCWLSAGRGVLCELFLGGYVDKQLCRLVDPQAQAYPSSIEGAG